MSKNTFYITTTLPYVNADPHVGFAMEIIRADTIARYKKFCGYEVFFNTGTDEHGKKLWEASQKEGKDIQTYLDLYADKFRELKPLLNISNDIHFIRTTDSNHIVAVQEFWTRCLDNGYIYKKTYQAKYCVGCELNKTDSELNQNGECLIHIGKKVEFIDEENYFFKFSAFQQKLLDLYEKNPKFVLPDFRLNEIKSFVEKGLEDFSISRLASKMPWGIPVPNDEEQVMYVWFDALVNYISTLGWPSFAQGYGEAKPESENLFEKFWVNGNPTQYCGKDNLRQQSAMWQAMLMACDLPCSHQIVVNGFITGLGGVKMSKSLGNAFNPYDVVKEYGTDALRYFLIREVSPFEDSPFTMERFKDSYNANLANGIGNLTSRLMNMIVTYDIDISGISFESIVNSEIEEGYNNFELNKVADIIWGEVAKLDQFIQVNEPFKKIKTDKEQAVRDLLYGAQILARIGVTLDPIMPETSHKIIMFLRERVKPESPLFLRKE
jgi:methionyl-tRNA synthetase